MAARAAAARGGSPYTPQQPSRGGYGGAQTPQKIAAIPPYSGGGGGGGGSVSKERQQGTLTILAETARNMPSRADAFLRIRLGNEDRRTKSVPQTNRPVWNERIQLKGTLQNFLRPLTVSLCDDAKRSGGQPLVLGQLSPVDLRQYLTQMDSRRFELDLPNGTAIVFTVTWEAAGAASASGAGAPSALEKMMANAAARSGQTPGHQRSCSGGSSGGLGLGAGALRSPTQSARSPPAAAGLMRGGKGGDSDRKGQLYVRVHSAKNLKAADLNFRSDPYVIANFGGTTAKTTVVKKTLSPTWEQTLDLGVHTVAAITSQPLNLKVYDEDQKRLREAFSSSDDLLGECSVRV